MNPFHSAALCFALAFSTPLINIRGQDFSARNIKSLSIDQLIQEALKNNPTIQSARATWLAMKARVPQAGAWDDPKVSFQQTTDRSVSVQRNAFADQMLSAEQVIPISGKNLSRRRFAEAETLAAFAKLLRQQLDVIAEVKSTYYRLAEACAQIDLTRQNLASLQQIEEASRSRYSAGDQSAGFVLMAQTESGKLLETARDLDLERSTEQSKLSVLLGRDTFATFAPLAAEPPEFSIPLAENLKALMFANRPEISMAEARVQQQKALVQFAHREWIPDPAISIQGQRYNGASQAASEIDAGISFNVPWVNASKYRAENAEAAANLQAAEADLRQARNEALGKLREISERLETSHHHLDLFRDKLIPQARQTLEATESAYESGKLNFSDWITAQRALRDLQAMEQQHIADYATAFAELEALIGHSLSHNRSTAP